jgi:hypothetical protein
MMKVKVKIIILMQHYRAVGFQKPIMFMVILIYHKHCNLNFEQNIKTVSRVKASVKVFTWVKGKESEIAAGFSSTTSNPFS